MLTEDALRLRIVVGFEAPGGFEPSHKGFADLSLTTWVRRQKTHSLHGQITPQVTEQQMRTLVPPVVSNKNPATKWIVDSGAQKRSCIEPLFFL